MIKQYFNDLKNVIILKKSFVDFDIWYSFLLYLGVLIPYLFIILVLKVIL